MTPIAYSGLFWTQFRVSRDLFTDLTAGKAAVRTFLPRLLTAASRIKNCTYRKIITYQTPQSNLPSVSNLVDNSHWLYLCVAWHLFVAKSCDLIGIKTHGMQNAKMSVVNCVTKAATFNVSLNTNGIHNWTSVLYNSYVIRHLCCYATARLINPNVSDDLHTMSNTITLCVYYDKNPYVTNRKNTQELCHPELMQVMVDSLIWMYNLKFRTCINNFIHRKLLDVLAYTHIFAGKRC